MTTVMAVDADGKPEYRLDFQKAVRLVTWRRLAQAGIARYHPHHARIRFCHSYGRKSSPYNRTGSLGLFHDYLKTRRRVILCQSGNDAEDEYRGIQNDADS